MKTNKMKYSDMKKPSFLLSDQMNSTGKVGYDESMFNGYLTRLKQIIDGEQCKDLYLGCRLAEVIFKEPFPVCGDIEVIALSVMRLLMKYVYNTGFDYGKFTIGYIMKTPSGEVSFMIGKAISLTNDSWNANKGVYNMIVKYVLQKAELYEKELVSRVFIRLYLQGMLGKEINLSSDEIDSRIWEIINADIGVGELEEAKAMGGKRRYPDHVSSLKPMSKKERRAFIVADMETVLVNDVHVPYAAGFLVVNPGEDVGAKEDYQFETYFSEDNMIQIPDFKERSNRMLFHFLERLAGVVAETKIRTVYFHNFSRFDGILLMKYYASHGDKYSLL